MSRVRGARAEGITDEEHKDRIRGWLRTYLTADEQQALCRLWMFKGGFQLEASQTMLGSSKKKAVEATLRGLRGTSCLQLSALPATDSSAARYSMHSVVGQIFRDKFDELPEPLQCSILEDYLRLLVTRMDVLEALRSKGHWPEANHAMAQELLNFQELLSILRTHMPCCSAALSEDSLKRLVGLGDKLASLGAHAEAAALLQEATQLASRSLGLRNVTMLRSLDSLAGTVSDLGEPAAATATRRHVLRLRRVALGEDHPDTLASVERLAGALQQEGQYAAAADAAYQQGLALASSGDTEGAAQRLRQAVQYSRNALGPGHAHTLGGMGALAQVLADSGDHAAAARQHGEALLLRQRALGEEHPSTLAGMHALAAALQGAGEHTAAAHQHARALALRRTALGAEHKDTLRSMHGLGAALDSAGDHAAAAKRLERAVRGREKVLGAAHEDTAATAFDLGCALVTLGRISAAARHYKQAAEAMEQLYGPDSPHALSAMHNHAFAVLLGGDQWEAARLFQQVARLRQKALGPQHAETLSTMLVLAMVMGEAGQAAAAGQYKGLQAWMSMR